MAITVAELLAKVRVEGLPQFQSQMNQASATTTQFYDKMGRLHEANGKFAKMTDDASKSVQLFGVNLGSLSGAIATAEGFVHTIEGAFHLVESAAMDAGHAILGFTTDAIREAAKVESMTMSFFGLGGSMKYARDEMEFLRQYATRSSNTFDALTASAVKMQGVGLNPNRFIEVLDRAGHFMTPGSGQGLEQLTRGMMSAAGGGAPGMVMRQFRPAGISYDAMREQGLKVSGNNHITATTTEFVEALERALHKRFDKFGEAMQNTMQVKFANLQDAWNRLLDSFGKAWFPLITRILDAVTPFVDFIARSGEIEKIGKGFADLFGGLKDGGWVRVFAYGVAVLEGLPGILRNAWNYMRTFMGGLGNLLLGFVDVGVKVISDLVKAVKDLEAPMKAIGDIARNIGGAMATLERFNPARWGHDAGLRIHDFFAGPNRPPAAMAVPGTPAALPAVTDPMRTSWEKFLGQLPEIGNLAKGFSADTDGIMARFNASLAAYGKATPDPNKGALFLANHAIEDATQETARNTEHIAAHMTDFKRFILGGGDRARTGVTLSERYGSLGRSQINVRVSGVGNEHFQEWLGNVIGETVQSMRRGGW